MVSKKQIANKTGHYHQKDRINEKIYAEIKFYLLLLNESLNFYEPKNESDYKKMADLRNEMFIETIKRVVDRKKDDSIKIINYVGSPHAYKNYINEKSDYYVGKIPQAKYFNDYVYKEKVYSVLIRPFYLDYYGEKTNQIENEVEKISYNKINEKDNCIYVNLKEFKKEYSGLKNTGYYNDDCFQFDGILYIKNEDVIRIKGMRRDVNDKF